MFKLQRHAGADPANGGFSGSARRKPSRSLQTTELRRARSGARARELELELEE